MWSNEERSGRLPLPVRTLYTGCEGGRSREGRCDGELGPDPAGDEVE